MAPSVFLVKTLKGEGSFNAFAGTDAVTQSWRWCVDIFREPWKRRQWFFRAVLGLANVWDVFLVSHIKVGGKSQFSSRVRTQAELLRSRVGGHVVRRLWSDSPWDLTDLVFRRRFQGLDLTVAVLQTWPHVAKNPCRGLTHVNWSSHTGKVSVPACGHRVPQNCNIICKQRTGKSCLPCKSNAALLLYSTLPSLQALSPLLNQILSRFLSCRAGSWPVIWWNSASKAQFWTGRNLRRRKQLHWLRRLRGRTKAGTSQCELNQHQLATCYMLCYDIRWCYNMKKKPISTNCLCAPHFLPDAHIPIMHWWCHLQTSLDSGVGASVSSFQTSTHRTHLTQLSIMTHILFMIV